jgi:hypothetical protein
LLRTFVLVSCLSCFAFGSQGEAPLLNEPPKDISIPDVIQSFAAKEKEFKEAYEQYAYTRDVTVTASCHGARPGIYHLVVDVTLEAKSKRVEKVKAADSTLQCIAIEKEDLDHFRDQSLFLLTTDAISGYQINFVGQQQQDNLRFYVFDVSPKSIQVGPAAVRGSYLGG